jgi:DNA-binding response OmpR family regulator
MPDGERNSFCRWTRLKWKELPIILRTVRNDIRDIISGFGDGADGYVAEPFELEILYSCIQALLRRAGNVWDQYRDCGIFLYTDQTGTDQACAKMLAL